MKYNKKFIAKNGVEITIENAEAYHGRAVIEIFNKTHEETDFLASYPDEKQFDEEQECKYLAKKAESATEVELLAIAGNKIVGFAGVDAVGTKYKVKHRANFGISVLKEYWGLGIGRALTESCIECAKNAGYTQLELSVVADNDRAVSLYKKTGFKEYGRNPKGFNSRISGYQEVVYMLLEL